MRMQESVGFIGLGVMGKPMARNVLAKGSPLVVHNRSRASVDELVAAGAERAASPADVARRARRIITMLPDSPDVEHVLEGPDGVFSGLQPGSILIRHEQHRAGNGPSPGGGSGDAWGADAGCTRQRR